MPEHRGRPNTPRVTPAMIERGLRDLGLRKAGLVLVHSSLSSFGRVEGGADAVIDALLAVLGPDGVLCMPTLTYGPFTPENPPPVFDPDTSACIVGRIPETFRRRPDVRRSLHPTHSMAAIGPGAAELLAGHEHSRTPIGPRSPWGKLCDQDGQVLMLGCGAAPMTLSHGPEEVCHEQARCTPPVLCRIRTPASEIQVRLLLHDSAYTRPGPCRAQLEGELDRRGLLHRATVGNATLLLAPAAGVWNLFTDWCRRYPGKRA